MENLISIQELGKATGIGSQKIFSVLASDKVIYKTKSDNYFPHEVFKHKNIEREWFQFTKDELDELVKDYGFTYAVEGATKWQ